MFPFLSVPLFLIDIWKRFLFKQICYAEFTWCSRLMHSFSVPPDSTLSWRHMKEYQSQSGSGKHKVCQRRPQLHLHQCFESTVTCIAERDQGAQIGLLSDKIKAEVVLRMHTNAPPDSLK